MPKLAIYKSQLENARDRVSFADDEDLERLKRMINALGSGTQRIELGEYPMEFARALLEDSKLKPNQRAVLSLHVHGVTEDRIDRDGIYNVEVGDPVAFGSALSMSGRSQPNAELRWNGRWYPIVLQTTFQEDENKLAKIVHLQALLSMGTWSQQLDWHVDPMIFTDDNGDPASWTVVQILERFGLRRVQTPAAQYNIRLVSAERTAAEAGKQVWVKGTVLELQSRFWFAAGLSERPLGTPEVPRRAVVEPTLDAVNSDREFYGGYTGRHGGRPGDAVSRLPLVRVFSFDIKRFVFVDVDDLETYEYDSTALARLQLPTKMKDVLATLFATSADKLFGDIVRGKHGGIVILASGNPGVGKTLTAEVYAEMAQRPLYVLEFGELGTTVKEIEDHLQGVFARVVRWNAVLQFDECEIFLAQRGNDLERSAIVGIFLRMLDYYEGLLFLTTNAPQTLDYAIRSRVMLRLEYPDLDEAARAIVWQTMFGAAGLKLEGGNFSALAKHVVNGRQIRNLVRLGRILHPDGELTIEQMLDALEYGCR